MRSVTQDEEGSALTGATTRTWVTRSNRRLSARSRRTLMPMSVRLMRRYGMLPSWADPNGGAANARPIVLAGSQGRDC